MKILLILSFICTSLLVGQEQPKSNSLGVDDIYYQVKTIKMKEKLNALNLNCVKGSI